MKVTFLIALKRNMHKTIYKLIFGCLSAMIFIANGCKPEPNGTGTSTPTPYKMEFPAQFPSNLFVVPADNPLTVEGVALGKKLFFDVRLSGDNTLSCGGCHFPEKAFADGLQFSKGIDGIEGDRNSMPLFNLAFNNDFFWNGRSASLEEQIIQPVINPVEMHQTWKDAVDKLNADPLYRDMFNAAFGVNTFDSIHVSKAIAQFLRTIISGDSRFQQNRYNRTKLSKAEQDGFDIFNSEAKGDCAHCHPADVGLMTDNYFSDINQRFHNNGLLPDLPPGTFIGRAEFTRKQSDNGMFKTPSLLNIALTAPYMHDGRFKTLEEVIGFYDTGVHENANLDNIMEEKAEAPLRKFENGKRNLHLTAKEKSDLLAFLKCLTDSTFLFNPAYRP